MTTGEMFGIYLALLDYTKDMSKLRTEFPTDSLINWKNGHLSNEDYQKLETYYYKECALREPIINLLEGHVDNPTDLLDLIDMY